MDRLKQFVCFLMFIVYFYRIDIFFNEIALKQSSADAIVKFYI